MSLLHLDGKLGSRRWTDASTSSAFKGSPRVMSPDRQAYPERNLSQELRSSMVNQETISSSCRQAAFCCSVIDS